jgi:transposase
MADASLRELSDVFDAMYAEGGRPSVPPERLLKAMLLMALYSVRSERMLCEQLAYNMLFRWFLDMDLVEDPFDHSAFSHNRERLIEHDVARRFFDQVVDVARARGLMSSDHFSVDGTLIEAWGSTKSFRPKGEPPGDHNGFADFKGQGRSNETHESQTDPEARLYRKGRGREAKLSHMAHAFMENRNGLLVDLELTEASGFAERDAAVVMIDRERQRRAKRKRKARKKQKQAQRRRAKKGRRITVAADKAYDVRGFVSACRERNVVAHIAQNINVSGGTAIDQRTTRHPGYRISSIARRLVEKIFGWLKLIGGLRRSRFRGRRRTADAALIAGAAFNLVRLAKLSPSPTWG